MTEHAGAEGATLSEALDAAVSELGVGSPEELHFDFDREHFRMGAYTVRIEARLKSKEEREALQQALEQAEDAQDWVEEVLDLLDCDAKVSTRVRKGVLSVEIGESEDSSLLIGREGRNIAALQLLLSLAMRQAYGEVEVGLDVDGYKSRASSDRGGRGRGEDRGGRSDRGGRGRGDRGDRGGRGRGGRGDREDRDRRVVAMAKEAIASALAGDGPVRLDDLNSYERHLAHSAAKEVDGVESRSVGRGPDRAVEIFVP